MDTESILSELRQERARLDTAIAALEGLDGIATRTPGRPKGGAAFDFGANKPPRRGRRRFSAAGRARIAAAAKAMWARRKKAGSVKKSTAAKKAAPARHMSPATRKRLSELAKKRWAARKKAAKA